MDDVHLNPTDVRILRHLAEEGCNSPSGLSKEFDLHTKNISNRLHHLLNDPDEPAVSRRSKGVYSISDYGRELLEEELPDDETVLHLELRREDLVADGDLTERGREWLEALEGFAE